MTTSVFKLLLVCFLFASCKQKINDEQSHANTSGNRVTLTAAQANHVNIRTGKVESRKIGNYIKANGVLDVPPQNLVSISPPMPGFVKHTELLQGMKVLKGQVLVTLEHPDYIQLQQDYLDYKSQMDYLGQEYERQQSLAKESVNSAKTLQLAQSNYISMKAKFEGAQARLRLLNINPVEVENGAFRSTISLTAPISGYITQVNINLGMHVTPENVMFRIIDNNHLHAEAQVFEKDVPSLKVGQQVRFTLSTDAKERTARVYLIGKEITPEHTVRVHCHLDAEDDSLIPGMYFNATIESDAVSTNTLPAGAFASYDNKDYVFIVKDEQAHQYELVQVQKGNEDHGFFQVTLPANVSADTPIVINGAYNLLSQLRNKGE